jgi:hypothetical protein
MPTNWRPDRLLTADEERYRWQMQDFQGWLIEQAEPSVEELVEHLGVSSSSMPEITQQQAHALEALDWLFSEANEDRRTGRTYILAVAYLRNAVNTGRWIEVEDPAGNRASDRWLLDTIELLARDGGIPIQRERVSRDLGRFRFRVAEAVSPSARRWLFEGFVVSEEAERRYGRGQGHLLMMQGRRSGMSYAAAARAFAISYDLGSGDATGLTTVELEVPAPDVFGVLDGDGLA